jgi:hypothetical protein
MTQAPQRAVAAAVRRWLAPLGADHTLAKYYDQVVKRAKAKKSRPPFGMLLFPIRWALHAVLRRALGAGLLLKVIEVQLF